MKNHIDIDYFKDITLEQQDKIKKLWSEVELGDWFLVLYPNGGYVMDIVTSVQLLDQLYIRSPYLGCTSKKDCIPVLSMKQLIDFSKKLQSTEVTQNYTNIFNNEEPCEIIWDIIKKYL